jgi:hypothetical protein
MEEEIIQHKFAEFTQNRKYMQREEIIISTPIKIDFRS